MSIFSELNRKLNNLKQRSEAATHYKIVLRFNKDNFEQVQLYIDSEFEEILKLYPGLILSIEQPTQNNIIKKIEITTRNS